MADETPTTPTTIPVVKVTVKGSIMVPYEGNGPDVVRAFQDVAELAGKVKLALADTPAADCLEFGDPAMARVKPELIANKPEAPEADG